MKGLASSDGAWVSDAGVGSLEALHACPTCGGYHAQAVACSDGVGPRDLQADCKQWQTKRYQQPTAAWHLISGNGIDAVALGLYE